jgi:hypothetical protein
MVAGQALWSPKTEKQPGQGRKPQPIGAGAKSLRRAERGHLPLDMLLTCATWELPLPVGNDQGDPAREGEGGEAVVPKTRRKAGRIRLSQATWC